MPWNETQNATLNKLGEEISREYLGNYLFAEHLRIGENRLEINELTPDNTDPDEITGGYLIQNGNQVENGSPNKFYTDRELCLANDTPTFDPSDPDYTNEEQKKYIRERIQDMEDAIFGEGVDDDTEDFFTNAKGIRYNEYMDMESAARYWLIQEVTNNGDAFITGSTYFYKKPDIFDGSGQMTKPAEEKTEMGMFINGNRVSVVWEDNESVETLRKLAAEGIEITMSMYGGFEQVGQIGQDIPANDEEITTDPGDIVLYSGNQLVVFYGSNSWAYTRLGHITDKTEEELEQLLGKGDVTIQISREDSE